MTRKKSNVKALALAVTCAILAGGYSGLNPVYAADTLYKGTGSGTVTTVKNTATPSTTEEITQITVGGVTLGDFGTPGGTGRIEAANVKISNNLTVSNNLNIGNDITISGSDGKLTVKAARVNGNNTVTGILRVGEIKGLDVIDPSTAAVSGQADLKINGATFKDGGAITATSLKLTGTNTVEDVGKAVNENTTNIANNKAAIGVLDGKTKDITHGADGSTTVDGVNFNGGAVTGVTSINDTHVGGVTLSGGTIEAASGKFKVYDNGAIEAASGNFKVGSSGTINALGIQTHSNGSVTLNDRLYLNAADASLQDKNTGEAVSVSAMAKTKYNTDKISYNDTDGTTIAGNVMVNKDAKNQVKITNEGIVVGLNSTVIGSDGVYAGGYTETTAKAVLGADGSIKGAGDGAGNYKFKVTNAGDVFSSSVTATLGGFNDVLINNGLAVGSASDKVAIGGGGIIATNGTDTVTVGNGAIVATGDIEGKDITAKGNLSVAGTSTFTGKTTFSGGINTDTIDEATADKGVTVDGVLLKDGGVNASAMSVTGVTGSLNVKDIGGTSTMIYTKAADGTNTIWIDPATGNISTNGTLQVGGGVAGTKPSVTIDGATGSIKVGKNDTEKFAVDGTTGNVKTEGSLEVASNATVGGNIKGQSLNIGATGTEFTVDTVGHMTSKSAQIGSVGITNTGVITGVTSLTTGALTVTGAFTTGGNLTVTGDLEASGAIKGKTISITDGGSIAGVSFATGGNLTATTGTIAGVSFATGGNVSGINNLTATGTIQGATLKVNDNNMLDNKGLKAEKAVIDSVVIDDASITSTGAKGLDVEKVNLNNGAITADKAIIGGVNTLDNTGIYVATDSKIQVGVNTKIEDGSIAVSTNTKLTDQALNLNAANKWTAAGGLEADKAAINGVTIGETAGKAVFNKAGKATTIDGDTIETGKITADELLIDKISLGKNGSSNISIDKDGHVQTKGDIKITDAAGNVMSKLSQDQAIFGKDAENQTTINNGKLKAKAKDGANQQAEFNFDENGLTVSGQNAAGQKSSFGFDTSTGIGTFTGQDNTTTAINGSNLTLTNGANSTALTAGGATFNGAAGEKGGTQTIINGGTITTDTLNVERINLGGELYDKNGTAIGGNLSMDKDGNFSAAGGNFKVTGGSGADKGAMTNTVGNTTLQTDTTGASMNYAGTANSNISVADGKAEMAVGANAAVTATDGKVEIKGGTQNVTTTDAGTVFENSAHNTPFVTGGAANTVINGNEITTGKLTTDQLVITGSGAAGGSGSIAFGGDGSITSNIKDAATGKEATFKTNADGTFTEAKDGANVTTNTVNAQGNTNKVTDGTNTSTATQTATSIGGVVTNGTVTMKQELTADGLKLEQTGYDEVNIAKGDVTVKNNRNTANPNQEVHLSDLGSLNNLDSELTARDEYKDNKTAVGAINAEAGIRREEVARLDNRIDDVNNRVDKVGAMAAAIASLKSIGYDPQAPSEFSIGLGQYKGETGVAMGFFHYPNKNFMINVSLSTAGGETMGGIGATWRFGHKSPQKLLDEQREAQARKELAAAEKYQAAAKLAKEAQERAEYAAKLARQAQVSADNAKAAADATQAKHFQ